MNNKWTENLMESVVNDRFRNPSNEVFKVLSEFDVSIKKINSDAKLLAKVKREFETIIKQSEGMTEEEILDKLNRLIAKRLNNSISKVNNYIDNIIK